MATRSTEERKADTSAKLAAVDANVWVASASPSGAVHLVPVSHTWNGTEVVVATEPSSKTVANVKANPKVRLALGDTRDVVMIDADLVMVVPTPDAPAALADGYAARRGGTPGPTAATTSTWYSGLSGSRPGSEAEELAGRTVMRNESWVV